MRSRPVRVPVPVLAALAAALLLSACTSGGSDDTASAAGDSAASLAEAGPEPVADAAGGTSGGGAQSGGTVLSGRVAPGPALIRTAELTVAVADVSAAAEAAAGVARAAGGDVGSEERTRARDDGTDGRGGSAVLVVRVPPKAFDATVGRLSGLGDERDRRLGTTDVTDQVVDLDSRIATQRASVERVRALLSRANSLGEVVQVEAELTKRTADLESLEARLASLEAQVDLSTVTLRLVGDDAREASPGGALGFSDGLSAGWDALTAVGRAAGVTLGALVPFSPLLLVGAALLWRSRSRRSAAA